MFGFSFVVLAVVVSGGYSQSATRRQSSLQRLDDEQSSANSLTCPERNGRFPNEKQCDAYIECEDGIPQEKLCPDGLLFNPKARYFSYPCHYPVDVDCTGRPQLQPAKATENCPHSYGLFKLGDENNCGQFVNCVEGRAYQFDCPNGLAFDETKLSCDWPDQVESCNAEEYLGFTCPSEEGTFGPYEYRFYRSPTDCQQYFVCVNGKPRAFSCPQGQGFNEDTRACDDAENVPACVFGPVKEPEFPPTRRLG